MFLWKSNKKFVNIDKPLKHLHKCKKYDVGCVQIIAQRKVYHKDKEQYFRNLNKDEVAVDAETISTYYNHRHIEWTADGNDGSRKIDRVKSNQLQ